MVEIIVIIALLGYIVWRQITWDRREHELLDRIMARNFSEFTEHTQAPPIEVLEDEPEKPEPDPDAMTLEESTQLANEAESEALRIMGRTL